VNFNLPGLLLTVISIHFMKGKIVEYWYKSTGHFYTTSVATYLFLCALHARSIFIAEMVLNKQSCSGWLDDLWSLFLTR